MIKETPLGKVSGLGFDASTTMVVAFSKAGHADFCDNV
jgi:hypothetical protein